MGVAKYSSSEIVVTGMGAVTPYGIGVDLFWQGLIKGECQLGPLTQFDTQYFANHLGGEILEPSLDANRALAMMRLAATEARMQSAIPVQNKVGVVLASNFGTIASFENGLGQEAKSITQEALVDFGFQGVSHAVAADAHCSGPVQSLSLSCSSGAAAIVQGMALLRQGSCDAVIVGGYDSLSHFAWTGLCGLRTMASEMLRPFHVERNGTLFSEGAGALVLELKQHAQKRQAPSYGQVLGGACNNNAYHMTAPAKEGEGLNRCMAMALQDAGVAPKQVNHINVHGTGTPYNDLTESQAINCLFKEQAKNIPVTSIKSMIGHTMGAAGALESIVTLMSLQHQLIPPTLHLDNPDPACEVDVVCTEPRQHKMAIAISNSSGIGGNNASLVFAKNEDTPQAGVSI